jgi:hypothetical protein
VRLRLWWWLLPVRASTLHRIRKRRLFAASDQSGAQARSEKTIIVGRGRGLQFAARPRHLHCRGDYSIPIAGCRHPCAVGAMPSITHTSLASIEAARAEIAPIKAMARVAILNPTMLSTQIGAMILAASQTEFE